MAEVNATFKLISCLLTLYDLFWNERMFLITELKLSDLCFDILKCDQLFSFMISILCNLMEHHSVNVKC